MNATETPGGYSGDSTLALEQQKIDFVGPIYRAAFAAPAHETLGRVFGVI